MSDTEWTTGIKKVVVGGNYKDEQNRCFRVESVSGGKAGVRWADGEREEIDEKQLIPTITFKMHDGFVMPFDRDR